MDLLQMWFKTIASKSNRSAMMFVMYQDSERMRAAFLAELLSTTGQDLMAQYVMERRVKAYCHLIKRSVERENWDLSRHYAIELNECLEAYSLSLLEIVKAKKEGAHRITIN